MDIQERFARDGFVVVPGLYSPAQCAAYKAEAQRLVAARGEHAGVFVGLTANSPVFHEAMRHPAALDALEAILGHDLEFLSDKVVFKSKERDFGSPWHQDYPYWEGAHKLSIWVALDPATPENGALKLLPGSHKTVATHDGQAAAGEGFGHRLDEGAVDESKAVTVPCAVGDAVIFHDLTLHASHPNPTGADRWAYISTYRSAAEPDRDYEWSVAKEVVRGTKRWG